MGNSTFEQEKIIRDIRNLLRLNKAELHFRQKKKLKQLKIEYLETLKIFFSMKKKKKIVINQ